jgi:hypothetical protein
LRKIDNPSNWEKFKNVGIEERIVQGDLEMRRRRCSSAGVMQDAPSMLIPAIFEEKKVRRVTRYQIGSPPADSDPTRPSLQTIGLDSR